MTRQVLIAIAILLSDAAIAAQSGSKPSEAFKRKVSVTATPGRCQNVKYQALDNEHGDLGPTPTNEIALTPKRYTFTCSCENGSTEEQVVRTQQKQEIVFSCKDKTDAGH